MMKLYDPVIRECQQLFLEKPMRQLLVDGQVNWEDAGGQNLILRKEMAYELGGGTKEAVSGLFFTSDQTLIPKDELLLVGPDLPELKEDASYARLTFVRVPEEGFGEGDLAYQKLRSIEYARYHVKPKGYMVRISAANEREPVRIGKAALEEGLDFTKVGNLFLNEYKKNQNALAVKMIFITEPDFPYKELEKSVRQSEQITNSLNYIFQNLKMDCSICGLKPVCDEVEGMRELHFAQGNEK